MRASELIARLQKLIATDGDGKVGIVMDNEQGRTADEITDVWPLRVSDRSYHIVINCKSIRAQMAK